VDTLDFSATTTRAVNLNLGNPAAQVVNAGLTLTLSSGTTIENAIGGALGGTITGNGLNNSLSGGARDHTPHRGGGAETLDGRDRCGAQWRGPDQYPVTTSCPHQTSFPPIRRLQMSVLSFMAKRICDIGRRERTTARKSPRSRLTLEALDDRILLSTITQFPI